MQYKSELDVSDTEFTRHKKFLLDDDEARAKRARLERVETALAEPDLVKKHGEVRVVAMLDEQIFNGEVLGTITRHYGGDSPSQAADGDVAAPIIERLAARDFHEKFGDMAARLPQRPQARPRSRKVFKHKIGGAGDG